MPKGMLQGTIRLKAIPSSDWFLASTIHEDLLLRDKRDVFILGIRCVYAMFHEPKLRAMVLSLVEQLRNTDLDTWQDQPRYHKLSELE